MESNPILTLIHERRSCRHFRAERPERSILEAIVEAGRCAPSAMNTRKTHFCVITDPKRLADCSAMIRSKLPAYADKDFRYAAPVMILLTNAEDHPSALQDISCAMENMMLAATALGVGSCWLNHFFHLEHDPDLRALMGVAPGERMCAALALGLPARDNFARRK